jgi:hypothetical protein
MTEIVAEVAGPVMETCQRRRAGEVGRVAEWPTLVVFITRFMVISEKREAAPWGAARFRRDTILIKFNPGS